MNGYTERLTQQPVYRLMDNRTTIAIAHRMPTIQEADWIYVLRDGRVVEDGAHRDLIETEGEYRRLNEQYRATHRCWFDAAGVAR